MELYKEAQNEFDAILAAVPEDGWDRPSMCREWTVRGASTSCVRG